MNYTRDPERTPMQWLGKENAGFTFPNATPWLPLAEDYQLRNVEVRLNASYLVNCSACEIY